MTKKEIRKRRWLKSLGHKKVLKIEKVKINRRMVYFVPPINAYNWLERFKSLFNFEKYVQPKKTIYKGREFILSSINKI